jgi:hypothetical protein
VKPLRLTGLVLHCLLLAAIAVVAALPKSGAAQTGSEDWIRPHRQGDPLIWGRRDGIVFGLASQGGIRGPRGLIRVGLFTPDTEGPQLLNFIAVEPVIKGVGTRFSRLGFSELEMSQMDPGQRGKRMWVHAKKGQEDSAVAGALEAFRSGNVTVVQTGQKTIERLTVRIDVERYIAGAHVYVLATIDSDHPKELRLTPIAENDSAPIEELTLTATMGNFERLRLLWLNNSVINSRELFSAYKENAFVEDESYPLPSVLRTGDGDAIVFCSSDEAEPRYSSGNETAHWVYNLPKLTQYWLVPGYDVEPNLRVRVNARRVYWGSDSPVLGGIAFENFEIRERYVPGQTFIFGITGKEPWEFYRGNSLLSKPTNWNPISNEIKKP